MCVVLFVLECVEMSFFMYLSQCFPAVTTSLYLFIFIFKFLHLLLFFPHHNSCSSSIPYLPRSSLSFLPLTPFPFLPLTHSPSLTDSLPFQGTVHYSAESDFGRSNSVLPTYVSYSSINGGQAFDRGLEEVRTFL